MDLDGDDISVSPEVRGIDVEGEKGPFLGTGGLLGGEGQVGERTVLHVAAGDLGSVQVDDGTVIALEVDPQGQPFGGDRGVEGPSEVGGDPFAGSIRAIADRGGQVVHAIAERRIARLPGGVAESVVLPVRTGVGAVVEVAPGRVRGRKVN